MSSIIIGTSCIESNLWLTVAIEYPSAKLVACTSSNHSAKTAEHQLLTSIHRLNRLSQIHTLQPSKSIETMIKRLWQLVQGKGEPFTLKALSIINWSDARVEISKELLNVPRGKVISYGDLAKRSNSSPRGVGSIMASNPVPWAIPCHRVIHKDGRLGKYGRTIEGSAFKRAILRAEGVPFMSNNRVDSSAIIE
jgi:O-6-methylguanine DNA methyltransferase